MNSHRQKNCGRGILVPILPPRAACGPPDRRNISTSMRALTSCPLAARPLGPTHQPPYRGLRNPTRKLRSGRAGNRPPFIKVRRGPTGSFRSPTTHYHSHMPTRTRNGNKAAPTTTPVQSLSSRDDMTQAKLAKEEQKCYTYVNPAKHYCRIPTKNHVVFKHTKHKLRDSTPRGGDVYHTMVKSGMAAHHPPQEGPEWVTPSKLSRWFLP